jgi:hypothetical protein
MVTSMLNSFFVGLQVKKPGLNPHYCPYCVKERVVDGEKSWECISHAGGVACFLNEKSRTVIPLVMMCLPAKRNRSIAKIEEIRTGIETIISSPTTVDMEVEEVVV